MSYSEVPVYRVVVRHNMVAAIEVVTGSPEMDVAASPLEVSSRMAANYQANGCLDGSYDFGEPETARQFATLGLDFIKRIADKATENLTSSHISEQGWRNPHCGAVGNGDNQ